MTLDALAEALADAFAEAAADALAEASAEEAEEPLSLSEQPAAVVINTIVAAPATARRKRLISAPQLVRPARSRGRIKAYSMIYAFATGRDARGVAKIH
ncbi:hypothetical protein [Streptomyces sp. 184]|uniref:hypothetical protein n=1 Tax=Streptomyces sp. 184 TaxID=1827526 RepID=UPI00389141D2